MRTSSSLVSDEPGRAGTVEEFLRQAGARSIVALTSTITIAEVVHGTEEKLHRALDDETERRVDELWAPGGPVTMIETSRRVLTAARGLIRANLAAPGSPAGWPRAPVRSGDPPRRRSISSPFRSGADPSPLPPRAVQTGRLAWG